MQNSVTKLAVIAGVIGIVLLALLQALRGMNDAPDRSEASVDPVAAPQARLGPAQSAFPELADLPGPAGQSEPDDAGYEVVRPAPSVLSDSQVEALPLGSRHPEASGRGRRSPDESERAEPTVFGRDERGSGVPVRPVSMPDARRAPFDDGEDEFDDLSGPSPEPPAPEASSDRPSRRPPVDFDEDAAPSPEPRRPSPEPRRLNDPLDLEPEPPLPAADPYGSDRRGDDRYEDDRYEVVPSRRNSAAPAGFPLSNETEEAPAAPPVAPDGQSPRSERAAPLAPEVDPGFDAFAPLGSREPRPQPLAEDDAASAPSPSPSPSPPSPAPERSSPAFGDPFSNDPFADDGARDRAEPPARAPRPAPFGEPSPPESPEPEGSPPALPPSAGNDPHGDSPAPSAGPLRSLPVVPFDAFPLDPASPGTAAPEPSTREDSAADESSPSPAPRAAPEREGAFDSREPSTSPEPGRLSPPAAAMRLDPEHSPDSAAPLAAEHPAELVGDATVDAAAPSGPQKPHIVLEKIAPETALLGQPLVYEIVVRNTGDSPASEVVVEDRIPAGTQLTGTIPRAELHDKKLTWRLGTLEPGDAKKISVRLTPLEEGEIGSVATVNFVAEVASRTKITTPRLKLAVEGPQQARIGEPVVFQFQVTNEGAADARNVVLRDMIPDGLSHPSGDDLEYAVGDLPAGESKQVRLTLTAARAGRTVNRAIVTADGNLTVEGTAAVEVLSPALAIARTGPARQFIGRDAIFTNAVTNESDRSISGATVTETVPEGCEFVEASHDGRYDPASRAIVWSIEQLGPRQSAVLKVKLRPTGAGTLESVVQATDASGVRSRAVSRTSVVGFAALGLDVNSERAPALIGDEVPLTVVVRNDGTADATRVGVTLDVPPELEFVSATGPTAHRNDGRQVVFDPIPEMESGTPVTIQAVFRATRAGDARIRVAIEADQMQRPLVREEAALVLDPNQ